MPRRVRGLRALLRRGHRLQHEIPGAAAAAGAVRALALGAILKFFFRYIACGRWYNPEGITAVPPDDYAARFEEFLLQEVLGVDAPAPRARTWSPFW